MAKDRLKGKKTLKVGGFLEEFEKDEVKKKVDILSLFECFGVKLTKKGKSYTGLCPWHNDKNPSLSVDREKGLYNCFGCGESGDVFSLVEKMKGLSFREALEYLKNWSGEIQAAPSGAKPAKKKKSAAPDPTEVAAPQPAPAQNMLPSTGPQQEPLPEITLRTVAEYYHKRFYGSKEAKEYFEKRGLSSGELLGRFGVGFADGSILAKLSNGQKEKLKGLGVLRDSGKEHLYDCITVPLHDNQGSIVGLYGRSIKDNGHFKHLYLKGPHRGIFNRKASVVYDEIILTESILDALSLINLGIRNVQALYGVNGLTGEHLGLLKADRVRTVILALDADEAGRKASESLKERLLTEGFSVKLLEPPSGKDWNEALVAGASGEKIRALIDQAPHTVPEKVSSGLEVKRQGPLYLATSGPIRYRLLGVRPLFVSSLRVNIRAEYEGSTFLDNVDLYSARSRNSFSEALSHLFGVEGMRIENDLLAVVDYLEVERDRELERRSDTGPRELTEEERESGLELLMSPDLFDRITKDLETLGYVGEELNKQLLYIAASSRKMEDPISLLILSQSASGKSLLVETVRRLMPEEDVVSVSSLSDQALNYLPEGGLVHKFLILGEAVHSETVEHQIREMLSAHELSRLVTMKDPKTGELSTRTVKSPVVVSAAMSSTRYQINPENASRAFVINIDESREQTKRIHSRQRAKYSLSRHSDRKNRIPQIIAQHQAAQRLLKPCLIVNTYAERLVFPDALMRTRRDHERFVDLIAAVCFLRQYQKQEKEEIDPATGEKLCYIECDLSDYRIAYRIMRSTLPATLSSFPPSACELYEAIRELLRQKARAEGLKVTEVSISQRDIREATEFSQRWIKRYMQVLTGWEYLQVSGLKSRGSRNVYRLVADEPIHMVDLSMIPTPEQMEEESNG